MAIPRQFVEAPPVTPLPFGLLSAALVTDDLTDHRQMGTQWESRACGQAYTSRVACEDDVSFDPGDDDSAGLPLVLDHPFTVYSMLRCNVVGLQDGELERRAADAIRLGEQRAVESTLAGLLPLADGAVDLTEGGGPMHPVEGLALLEEWAAENYGGIPTVHVPRRVGALLASGHVVERQGGRLETAQGAYVASGGGYRDLAGPPVVDPDTDDPAVPAAAGQAWLYVTGTTVVRRGPVETVPMTMNRAVGGRASNVGLTLAMRPYSVAWECITGAVLVEQVRA